MSISSITFLFFFLPAVLVLCYALRLVGRDKAGALCANKVLLLLASVVFYSWTALQYLPHLVAITLFVYVLAAQPGSADAASTLPF